MVVLGKERRNLVLFDAMKNKTLVCNGLDLISDAFHIHWHYLVYFDNLPLIESFIFEYMVS